MYYCELRLDENNDKKRVSPSLTVHKVLSETRFLYCFYKTLTVEDILQIYTIEHMLILLIEYTLGKY